ncbi:MAG: SurA N-terminal domain-containing protein [Candidatus Omnitrophica bacterium]|nr:SurA N-terminal domain-containing protein [Candidatus Omnitrophota bacterium]MDD5430038.1 SurA N-terminal domain-containing protein [Candidatus Omnitrophota bacterium]
MKLKFKFRKRKIKKAGVMKTKIFLILFIALQLGASAEEITRIVAKVNNQVITSRDLDDYCKALNYDISDSRQKISLQGQEFNKEALKRLIEDKLVLGEAIREKIQIPQPMIDNRLDQIISSYPSRQDFEASLLEKGFTVTSLKKKIESQYMMREVIDKYVKSMVSVSPQEIFSYYSQNKDSFQSPEIYIFYIAKSQEKSILEDISKLIEAEGIIGAQNAYWGLLMKMESTKEELKADIAEVLEKLKSGSWSIKQGEDLYYLIYLDKIMPSRLLSFEEVQRQVYSYLWEENFQKRFKQWIGELKDKAVIENYYE